MYGAYFGIFPLGGGDALLYSVKIHMQIVHQITFTSNKQSRGILLEQELGLVCELLAY
jgi:hypothetical protein